MGMMLAGSLPMLMAVGAKLKTGNSDINTTVARFAEACRYLIEKKKFVQNSPYYELCLKAMAGSFVLYDMISNEGGFNTRALKAKKIISLVCNFNSKFEGLADTVMQNQLKSLIQFGSPNFDNHASNKIRDMLSSN